MINTMRGNMQSRSGDSKVKEPHPIPKKTPNLGEGIFLRYLGDLWRLKLHVVTFRKKGGPHALRTPQPAVILFLLHRDPVQVGGELGTQSAKIFFSLFQVVFCQRSCNPNVCLNVVIMLS